VRPPSGDPGIAASSADAETLQIVEVAGPPCSTLHRDEVAEIPGRADYAVGADGKAAA
jgi:hypothetical protein